MNKDEAMFWRKFLEGSEKIKGLSRSELVAKQAELKARMERNASHKEAVLAIVRRDVDDLAAMINNGEIPADMFRPLLEQYEALLRDAGIDATQDPAFQEMLRKAKLVAPEPKPKM